MPSSGIIDLAIGLIFVFAVAAALSSFVTELISRLMGLRAAYLLSGLRELVDGGKASTDLSQAQKDYKALQGIIKGRTAATAGSPPPKPRLRSLLRGLPQTPKPLAETAAATVPSVTGALLSSPILANQGIAGQFPSRKLTLGGC